MHGLRPEGLRPSTPPARARAHSRLSARGNQFPHTPSDEAHVSQRLFPRGVCLAERQPGKGAGKLVFLRVRAADGCLTPGAG